MDDVPDLSPIAPPGGAPADDALPVAVDIADRDLAAAVTAHVESVLGWQVVRPGPHLRVRLRLADRPGGAADPTPTVVVWDGDGRPPQGPAVWWPDQAQRLPALVPPPPRARPPGPLLVVGGAAPGVGTSTVALALGGLLAWSGRPASVLTDADGARLAGVADRAGVPPVPGDLRIVTDPAAVPADGGVVVVDRGVPGPPAVLVGRPDGRLLAALRDPDPRGGGRGPAVVVTVGDGALRPAELARALSGRPHVALPWSFRVARAGLRGRVPTALPGRWVAALGPVVEDLAGGSAVARDAGPRGEVAA